MQVAVATVMLLATLSLMTVMPWPPSILLGLLWKMCDHTFACTFGAFVVFVLHFVVFAMRLRFTARALAAGSPTLHVSIFSHQRHVH